ncbi:dsDNA nuclease domain-containing protein [Geothrix edaphica]|nr:dsDNA nuclease domain-containing protein [Geothrix edaphica]
MTPSPDTVPAVGDPGDDTARRYRYQWTYAAICCCMLLDETEDVEEVFCEHHEDIVLRHTGGMFSGLQIKTRESNQDVWKANEATVINSCARFAKLENQFPGQFRVFRFLTNHPLFAAENGKNLRYVLNKIKTTHSIQDLPGPVARFLRRVAQEADLSQEIVFTALSKTEASDDLPKLADIDVRLVATLTEVWTRAADCAHSLIVKVGSNLTWECGKASSLAHQDVLPAYISATIDPEGRELLIRIESKCINRSHFIDLLEAGLNLNATLEGAPEAWSEPGVGNRDLLLKKLDAGGFSAISRNSALDLRDKADYLGIVWTRKHGRESGLQRYGHVRSLVLSDAARVFEIAKSEEHLFGLEMLSELRSRFLQRRMDGSQLYECSNEHLEGVAYSLTSECLVQWSLDRPWEVQG